MNKSVGKARIGGSYSLVDHNGRPVTSADFHGKYVLMYFGFVNCPDVCPAEMERLAAVIDAVDADPQLKGNVTPVFISVDPARDSVDEVAEYVADYHPKMVGLTGTPQQIETICKSFRVFYHVASELSEDDYMIDHSIIMYLMDRRGEFVDFFGTNMTLDDIKERVTGVVRRDLEESGQVKPWWYRMVGL
jgi:protein SCO1